jgi:glycosyltransferase involved in cell wall biosynthesis
MSIEGQNISVLIITNHYPDRWGGGSIASRGFINAFAENYHDCTLIYPDNGADIKPFLHTRIKTLPCRDLRPKWLKGLGVYFGKLHRFSKITRKYLAQCKPDLVVFDTSIVSLGLIDIVHRSGIKIITIHHNVEQDYFSDNRQPTAIRFPYLHYLKMAERKAVLKSDLSLTLTEFDQNRLTVLYDPGKILNIKLLGVFEPFGSVFAGKKSETENSKSGILKFVISGNLSFGQSNSSIIEFIRNYYPLMDDVSGNFELIIAGSNPSENLRKLCANHINIRLISDPENLSAAISDGDIYICPVDRGSGLKLRIMDGLKLGMPVLAHEVSSRGYECFIDAKIMFTYKSISTFRTTLKNVLDCKIENDMIRKFYFEIFSFESGSERLGKILEENSLI